MDKRIAAGVGLLGVILGAMLLWLASPADTTGPRERAAVPEPVTAAEASEPETKRKKKPKLTQDERDQARREIREALVDHAGLAKIECEVPDTWVTAAHGTSDGEVVDGVLTAAVDDASGVLLSHDGSIAVTWKGAEGGTTTACKVQEAYDVDVTFQLEWVTPRPAQVRLKLNVVPEEGTRTIPMPNDTLTVAVPAGSLMMYEVELDGGKYNALSETSYIGNAFAHGPPEDPRMTVHWKVGDPHVLDAEQAREWEKAEADHVVSAGMVTMSRAEQRELIGEHLTPVAAQVLDQMVDREVASAQEHERFKAAIDGMLRSHGVDLDE